MLDTEKVNFVKAMCEETDDTVISVFLEIAKSAILNRLYPYEDEDDKRTWKSKYDNLQCRIAVYLLEKRGAEGEITHTENGVTRTYSSADIPNALLYEINPVAKVR